MKKIIFIFHLSSLIFLTSCNPFAPKLDESSAPIQFGDAHTVPGFFQAFKYAYEFKDTTTYGALLTQDFTFAYRNNNTGADYLWSRDEDMRATSKLFSNAESISLNWQDVFYSSGTDTTYDITRNFELIIIFNGDEEHIVGRAAFYLERASTADIWRAKLWQDQSNL